MCETFTKYFALEEVARFENGQEHQLLELYWFSISAWRVLIQSQYETFALDGKATFASCEGAELTTDENE